MNSGIYVITSPSGKGYVGATVKFSRRKTKHFNELRSGKHHCHALQRAWNKYGDQLKFVVIERCIIEKLIEREQFWLDHPLFRSLYNSRLDASMNASPSEETKKRISVSKLGKTKSAETKAKMRKPKSPEHAAAISKGKKGKGNGVWTPERLIKQREAARKMQDIVRSRKMVIT